MKTKDVYELTNPQKSIWLTEQFYSDTTVNNICTSGTIYEKIDLDLLKKAVNNLVKQNDSFRIRLFIEDGKIKQYISDFKEFDIDVEYINNESDIKQIEESEVQHKFNMLDSDLFKFKFAVLKNGYASVILTANHIISDSWSMGLTIQEILRNYHCLKNNTPIESETNSYIDYINSENEYKASKKYENDKEYWNEVFSTIPEQATIPSTKNNSKDISYDAKRLSFNIDKKLLTSINDFCKSNNISIFNFFMAIFSIYISRVSNIDDFVIGTPILNRTNFKDKHTMGMFVNTAPVRINNVDTGSFKDFVSGISRNLMGILRHQKYSYNTILEDLRNKNENIPNLYNIIISYQITKAFDEQFGNYKTNWTFNNYCANDFNIHIYDINDTGDLIVNYDYLISKYSEEDVTDIHNRIIHMINQILSNYDINSNDIEIVTEEEKHKILNVFNNTYVDYPKDKTIVDLFEEQVEKTPDNIAVVFEDKKLTYKELNEKANSLARYLMDTGVTPGTVIGLRLNKKLEMIIGILAIIKCGGCYLPINMQYPQDRVEFMLRNSNAKLLLGTTDSLSEMNLDIDKKNIDLTEQHIYSYNKYNLNIKISPEDLIYIIYTSGSTGTPKGAMLCHRNIVRLFKNDKFLFNFGENDTWTMFHSVAFDFSVWEMYGALLFGGKLVLVTDEIAQDPELFLNLMRKENVTVLNQTPTYFYKLLKAELEKNDKNLQIRYIIFGGEALKPNLIKNWHIKYPNTKLINMYGITETTVHVTYKELSEQDLESPSSNIGMPIPTLHVIIVDKNLNLLPFGVEGEMCVIGEGVFKGYLNREDLNKTKLIKIPSYSDKSIYRSGDTAIMHKDGHLEYLGRIDTQVKIRGFRIELGEIEQKILKYSNIETCIVTKKIDENNRELLCAYYIKNGPLNISALRILLNKHLPSYMIPQYFIEIDKVPININGKTDFKALPLPQNAHTGKKMVKARNDVDKSLIEIYQNILHISNISLSDSFFELGGDSLTAINICETINNELKIDLKVKDILEKDNLMDLSDYISTLNQSIYNDLKISSAEKSEYYPLSSAQKRIYYASKIIGENNLVYNIPGAVLINKTLDKDKVENCFNKIIKNQSSFRTSFELIENDVKQKINNKIELKIPTFENTSTEIQDLINTFPKPFNLESCPLLRVELHYIDKEKTLLLLDSHHIIMDGTSLKILIEDFCKLYTGNDINDLEIDYKDFSVWENKFIESDSIKESENYWINKFKNSEISSINLPYDFSIPSTRTYRGNTISKKIKKEYFDKYLDYANQLGVSPYMFFISAFFILLYKYTGQEELILGSPTSGRNNNQLKNIIGMFVNNIVINAKIDSNEKFVTFLNKIKSEVLQDLTYQNYPYDLLVKKLNLPTDNSSNPLFDVMFSYQNTDSNKLTLDNESVEIIKSISDIAKFNLSVEINPDTKIINLEYRTDLFKENTINRLFEHYMNTLNCILDNEDILVKDISIISDEEKNKILYNFNDTYTDYPRDKTVIQVFEEQVKKTPNDIALVFEGKSITYKELNEKANQLSHYIKSENFMPEDVICILLDKSIEMIIAILAILKNRCAYLPIDITYPEDRIEYIIKDSKSKLLLTSKNLSMLNIPIKSLYIDLDNNNIYNSNNKNNISIPGLSSDLAYIMYTSGSTGNPKGVMIENKSILRLIINNNYISFHKNDRILQTGSIVFDACTFEIWGAFFNGLPLYIIKKDDLLDPSTFHDYILNNGITVLWLTAPLFNQLCESNPHMFKSVRCVLTGGDVLSPKHINMAKIANPNLIIINGYGPTENTTFSCCYNIDKKYTESIPIGGPISNSTCYVVSDGGSLQPIGIPGELWVGGDGLARGYFNNVKLSSEKFIYYPEINSRVYKTGDLVKWNVNGYLEFLGRIDNQIKIRGFRVELSEINTIINSFNGIKECYTIFDTVHNQKSICAYVVSDSKVNFDDLKKYLANHLPKYMLPKYFMQLDCLPINQNGKINKKLLPRNFDLYDNNDKSILPSTELEQKIYDIFKKVLDLSEFSVTDSFFDLGGDSISAMKLQMEALKNNIDITYGDIFKYLNVKNLANCLNLDHINTIEESTTVDHFSKFDDLLKNNKSQNLQFDKPISTPIGNVLLTGVTGFLGSHILDSFIKNETGKIFCLIRPKNNFTSYERLKSTLNFYFDDKYDNLINNRIFCVEGDITKEKFGLSEDSYINLGNQIDTVIHSAALVKHFGNYEEFKKINIDGTNKVIEFSKKFNCKLMHISTISVSGNNFAEGSFIENTINEDINYDETNFFVGQNLENLYVKSKFLAEKLVFEAIQDGLNAYVLRMGNLTSRYSEGKFQQNHYENAFVNRIKSLLQIGYIPEYMQDGYVEFTPIDCCADAIIHIANNYNPNFSVFHVFNEKHVQLMDLYDMLRKLGIPVNIITSEQFNSIIDELLKTNNGSNIISGIIRDFNSERKLVYQSNIKIKSDFTKDFLKNCGFEWPNIDINYIKNYFKYLSDIGYLNLKLKEN